MASQPVANSIAVRFDIFNVSRGTKGKGVNEKRERPTTFDFSFFLSIPKKLMGIFL